MNDQARAITTRSIRTIQTEIDYLIESSLITQQQAAAIRALLPPPSNSTPDISSLSLSYETPPLQPHQNQNQQQQQQQGWHPPPTPNPQQQHQQSYATPAQQQPPAYIQPPTPAPAPQQRTALTYATAIYAYNPTDLGDLALAPQDRVAVTEYMNAEWWKGRSERTGQEGIFPRSYVREEGNQPHPTLQEKQTTGYGGNMPMAIAQAPGQQSVMYAQQPGVDGGPGRTPGKGEEMAKKAGKKLGNAALFGAGATFGSNIVNSIF